MPEIITGLLIVFILPGLFWVLMVFFEIIRQAKWQKRVKRQNNDYS